MSHLRLIGDLHGNKTKHLALIRKVPYSIQVGDLGFDYRYLEQNNISPNHKFFGGNHDNYTVINESPYNLGDYGVCHVPEFGDVFWVRGAWSIDRKKRHEGVDWWADEELSYGQLDDAIRLYQSVKPKILLAHECPLSVVEQVTNPQFTYNMGYDQPIIRTRTNQALQVMVESHRPHLMVFGHYHKSFDKQIGLTRYVCINIGRYLDLSKDYLKELGE